MLVDVVEIKVKAGDGGPGKVSFRRERNVPKGGPDGGNGGSGGSVYIVADHNMSTLMDFRTKSYYEAGDGASGGRKYMTGADGEDITIKVPAGTLVYEKRETGEVLVGDLVRHNQQLLIARGGRGGRGNTSFKSSTNRTPRQFTRGIKGERKEIKLEVKLIADVGLIGFPNAGKSTLINKLTSSKAKVGSYPFTTLAPNLGVCVLPNGKEIVLADIPGLIEGASEGKGLGDEFLRHIERTRFLVHLVDPSSVDASEDVWKKYIAIRNELGSYNEALLQKEELVAINKVDLVKIADNFEDIKRVFEKEGINVIGISAMTGEGVDVLKSKLMEALERLPQTPPFKPDKPVKLYDINTLPNKRMIFKKIPVQEA